MNSLLSRPSLSKRKAMSATVDPFFTMATRTPQRVSSPSTWVVMGETDMGRPKLMGPFSTHSLIVQRLIWSIRSDRGIKAGILKEKRNGKWRGE